MPLVARANAYRKHMKLEWCPSVDLTFLDEEVFWARNEISHKKPSLPVSPETLARAAQLLASIPRVCAKQAGKLYGAKIG